jgi:hypothetical protein
MGLLRIVVVTAAIITLGCKDASPPAPAPAETRDDPTAKSQYVGHWLSLSGTRLLSIVQEGDAFIVQDETRKRFVARLEKGVFRLGTPTGGSIDFLHVRASDHLVGGGEEYRRISKAQAMALAHRLDVSTARRESMRRMREIAVAWEARATDVNSYVVRDLAGGNVAPELLAGALMPTYMRDMPRTDGWDNPFLFDVSEHGGAYSIRSGGEDGHFDLETPRGATYAPGADIVFSNGNFISYPAGVE